MVFVLAGFAFHGVVCLSLYRSWMVLGMLLAVVSALGIGLKPPDAGDEYRAVTAAEHTLFDYPCGVRARESLRLKRDLKIVDHDGHQTRASIPAGSIWRVLPGLPYEPEAVWLEDPEGLSHTWDDSVLDDFEKVDSQAAQRPEEADFE